MKRRLLVLSSLILSLSLTFFAFQNFSTVSELDEEEISSIDQSDFSGVSVDSTQAGFSYAPLLAPVHGAVASLYYSGDSLVLVGWACALKGTQTIRVQITQASSATGTFTNLTSVNTGVFNWPGSETRCQNGKAVNVYKIVFSTSTTAALAGKFLKVTAVDTVNTSKRALLALAGKTTLAVPAKGTKAPPLAGYTSAYSTNGAGRISGYACRPGQLEVLVAKGFITPIGGTKTLFAQKPTENSDAFANYVCSTPSNLKHAYLLEVPTALALKSVGQPMSVVAASSIDGASRTAANNMTFGRPVFSFQDRLDQPNATCSANGAAKNFNATRNLFDLTRIRENWGVSASSFVGCPTPMAPPQTRFGGGPMFYMPEPNVDPKLWNKMNPRYYDFISPYRIYQAQIAFLGDRYVQTGDVRYASCMMSWLNRWARPDGLFTESITSTSTTPYAYICEDGKPCAQPDYDRKEFVGTFVVNLNKIKKELNAQTLNATHVSNVKTWLGNTLLPIRRFYDKYSGVQILDPYERMTTVSSSTISKELIDGKEYFRWKISGFTPAGSAATADIRARSVNNHNYWGATIFLGWGFLFGETTWQAYGLMWYDLGVGMIDSQGRLETEMERASQAFIYTNFAMTLLTELAEMGQIHGFEMYSRDGNAIRRLKTFLQKAHQTTAFGSDGSALFGVAQKFTPDAMVKDNPSHVTWAEIWFSRYGDSLNGTMPSLKPLISKGREYSPNTQNHVLDKRSLGDVTLSFGVNFCHLQ